MLQEALELGNPQLWRAASGFGGGIARMGDVCGVVSGGVMALSLQAGKAGQGGRETADLSYQKVREFYRHFQETFGTVDCRILTGYDLTNMEQCPEKYEQFRTDPERRQKCQGFIDFAVRYLVSEEGT